LGDNWRTVAPLLASLVLIVSWGSNPSLPVVILLGVLLAATVLAALSHAEVLGCPWIETS
jgi:Ca2+:H+ antiporter